MEKCDPKDNSIISSAICSLWKIYKCLLQQIAFNIMLLLVNNVYEKTSWRVRTDKILKASAHYNFALLLHENALIFR